MMRNQFRRSVKDQLSGQVEEGGANNPHDDTDLHKVSADYYERSWRMRIKLYRDDWWIALGVYSLLISIAFAVL